MATKKKSKPAKKAAQKAKAKPKAKAAKKPTPRSPRSQVLPGMEQVRNAKLDRICEDLSDIRRTINRAAGEEKDLHQQAMRVMVSDKVPTYTQSGIRLTFTEGQPHLSVKLVKEQAVPKKAPKADETGTGQDAGATLEEMTDEPEDTTDVEREFDAENNGDDE